MGGVFSGRQGPRGGKTAVDRLPTVQINGSRGSGVAAAAVGPRMVFEAPDLAEVIYGTSTWHVHVAVTTPHFGGERRWLVCPRCSCRRTALYIGGNALACRVCLDLRYPSQHETERDRRFRLAHKLRDRLGWGGGVAEGGGGRPGGMHERTYRRLCTALASHTKRIFGDLEKWLARADASLGIGAPTSNSTG